MNKKIFPKGKLIGRIVKIKNCTDPTWVDKSGVILDETKNTFLIEIDYMQKRIAKKIARFEFKNNDEKIILNGSEITFRCEDRIKKTR